MKEIIFLLIIVLTLFPLISGQEVFKQNEVAEIKVPCFNNGTLCSTSATCNITVIYPNGTSVVDNQEMTLSDTYSYYNYTLNENQTVKTGEYDLIVWCQDGVYSGFSTFPITINPTGEELTDTLGFTTIGIIFSIIAIAFMFLLLANKFADSDKLFPIALFFFLVTFILIIYSIHLGYIFSRDILFPLSTEGGQWKIYLGLAYGLIGMSFLGMLFLTLKTLKEFKVRKSIIRYGEGWDIKTGTYH